MKKLIIFDFWGTLVENGVRPSPAKQVQYFLRTRAPFNEFITTFESVFMTRKFDSLQQGFEEVVKAFDLRIPDFVYEKLVGMWNKFSILSKPYEDTFQALEELRKEGYKLVLLANTDNFSLAQVLDKFHLSEHFDGIYLSCETGLLKSNKEAFERLLEDQGMSAQDALMVGDSPQSDLEGAENAGVDAVLIDRRGWYEGGPKIASLLELDEYIKNLG